jgi:carbonic anhydrase
MPRAPVQQSLDTAELWPGGWKDAGEEPGSAEGDFIDWLTIEDQAESVTADVARIRAHPLVPRDVALYGYIYDVRSGKLIEVPAATEAGRGQGCDGQAVLPWGKP